MEITVGGIKIFYERYEGEGEPVVILHGWGADSGVMQSVFGVFKAQGRSVISLDLPFFGKSDPPDGSYSVFDYAQITADFLERLGCREVTLLGHSFGGRLAVILASSGVHNGAKTVAKGGDGSGNHCAKSDKRAQRNQSVSHGLIIKKLILIDSAGCKPRLGFKKRFRILIYKIKRFLKIPSIRAGSEDYRRLPPFMKGVFVRVVNTHLERRMKEITVPTLLIWGENDADTPPYMAKRMNRLIKNSGLVMLENAAHFSFLDKPGETELILRSFIES